MRTLGRLLRLSLAPSAAADVAAGILLGAGVWPSGSGPWLLIAASLCVYHGGLVLNDWVDRDHDAQTRPERPIPSGRVPANSAALLGFALLVAGPWIALGAGRGPALVMGAVATLALAYDLFGRGPLLGPTLLGLCRAGNLTAGLVFGRVVATHLHPEFFPSPWLLPQPRTLCVAAVYGVYVFTVSTLGRLEDGEGDIGTGKAPTLLVALLAALILCLPLLALPLLPAPEDAQTLLTHPRLIAAGLAGLAAFGLVRVALTRKPWSRERVQQTMGMALRRLLVITACAALLRGNSDALVVTACILAGYPLSYALRKAFPPS